jgi:RNA polymerase sigma factor for flagellar operon FliA
MGEAEASNASSGTKETNDPFRFRSRCSFERRASRPLTDPFARMLRYSLPRDDIHVAPPPPSAPTDKPDPPEVLARVNESLGLVEKLAHQMRRQISSGLALDDLVSYGREGLLLAARNFDETRGVPFRCYASLRVRGAMMDGLRATGTLPRRAYKRMKMLEAAAEMQAALVEEDAARPVTDAASADDRVGSYAAQIATVMALRVVGGIVPEPQPQEEPPLSPEDLVARREMADKMRASIDRLPEQEKRLVLRHYFDEVTIEDAAREISLSKSWGSRLHARAIEFLTRDLKRAGIREP